MTDNRTGFGMALPDHQRAIEATADLIESMESTKGKPTSDKLRAHLLSVKGYAVERTKRAGLEALPIFLALQRIGERRERRVRLLKSRAAKRAAVSLELKTVLS